MKTISVLAVVLLFIGCSTTQTKGVQRHLASDGSPCIGIEIGAQYQLIPVDGTISVYGQLPTKDLTGANTNPIVAEAKGEMVAFNVYESVIPSKIGTFLGTVATAQGSTTPAMGCELSIDSKALGKHRFVFIDSSTRGDIILENYDPNSSMKFLVIKKIEK
ncbi:MAG TPA: hypothetical protein VJB59_04790 [Bdellovibrionota bacterium]|nr:hypothetical protein [Bdellovibrionota bacterium]